MLNNKPIAKVLIEVIRLKHFFFYLFLFSVIDTKNKSEMYILKAMVVFRKKNIIQDKQEWQNLD